MIARIAFVLACVFETVERRTVVRLARSPAKAVSSSLTNPQLEILTHLNRSTASTIDIYITDKSTMKFLLFLAFCLQSVTFIAAANDAATTDDGAILVLGDSWASLSGDYMSNICGPQTTRPVQNDAKSGSTADDWASGETAVKSMTNANYDYDYVWLSKCASKEHHQGCRFQLFSISLTVFLFSRSWRKRFSRCKVRYQCCRTS